MANQSLPKSSIQALESLKSRLAALHPESFESTPNEAPTTVYTPKGADFQFLNGLLSNSEFKALLKMHDRLASARELGLYPITGDAEARLAKVVNQLGAAPAHLREKAEECRRLLTKPNIKAVTLAYDTMAKEDFGVNQDESAMIVHRSEAQLLDGTPFLRLVFKRSGEPLGCTIRSQISADGAPSTFISQLVAGSFADRCGLLYEGDELVVVNDQEVRGSSTDTVLSLMGKNKDELVIGVIPKSKVPTQQRPLQQDTYVRALFDYEPEQDPWIPAKRAGLAFKRGDVLQILRQDTDWWHARHINGAVDEVGFIPSITLQTRRPKGDHINTNEITSTTSLRAGNKPKKNQRFETPIRQETYYEIVTLVQPEKQHPPPIVLIGPKDVGRHTLKKSLLETYPSLYDTCISHTTRPAGASDVPGVTYHFTSRKRMQASIDQGEFIEYGEFEGQLYGTSVQSVLDVVDASKFCLIDTEPETIPRLRNRQLQALVVFVQPPNLRRLRETRNGALSAADCTRILRQATELRDTYGHLFDFEIVNDDLRTATKQLHAILTKANQHPRWVPMSWSIQRTSIISSKLSGNSEA